MTSFILTKSLASNLGVSRLQPNKTTASSKNSHVITVTSCLPMITGNSYLKFKTLLETNPGGSSSPSITDHARRESVSVPRTDVVLYKQQPRPVSQQVQTTTTQSSLQSMHQMSVRVEPQACLLYSHGPCCCRSGQLPTANHKLLLHIGLTYFLGQFKMWLWIRNSHT